MLGFAATVHHLLPFAEVADLHHVRQMHYGGGVDYARRFRGEVVIPRFFTRGAGVLDLVEAARAKRVMLVHDGGYPYIVVGFASEFRGAFVNATVEFPFDVGDADLLLLEAWDQS